MRKKEIAREEDIEGGSERGRHQVIKAEREIERRKKRERETDRQRQSEEEEEGRELEIKFGGREKGRIDVKT